MEAAHHQEAVQAERRAREQLRRVRRAQRAKASKHTAEVWAKVKAARRQHRCSCELHRGMTLAELNQLDGCCTPRWVCPVLDLYRRLVSR